ncbi:MFS transporter [Alkanindiges sp. WGS2144]|uniref:MFS transporter n=1 Tax=Alkanindiges sp. WGS2144 TaxID=3366808 RepID=UPI00375220B0
MYSIGLLLSLYLAQGLPVGFLTQALPAILRQNHVSLAAIGGFGLLMAPWALKFLWAPLVDRYFFASFGQSRSWIIPTQILTVVFLAIISLLEPNQLASPFILLGFFIVLFLINVMGATQDIATDGLAVRLLQKNQQHWGNAVQVLGSRLGFIFGGGAVLLLLDIWSWQMVFGLLTVLVFLNGLPVFLFKEPRWQHQQQVDALQPMTKNWLGFFKSEFAYFWQNRLMRGWLLVLLTFKAADGLSSAMVKPMMVDMGFRLSDIGLMVSMLGALASLLGALLAALLMKIMSRSTALWGFNLLQAVGIALYGVLAWQYQHWHSVVPWQVYAVNAFEHAVSAMALVAVLTVVMDYSRKKQAGSDFTFQVSIMAMVLGGLHIISGLLAEAAGYVGLFAISTGLALVCLLPVFYWRRLLPREEVKAFDKC